MINTNQIQYTVFLAIFAAALSPITGNAKNYDAREKLDKNSRMKGTPVSDISLLERMPGLGNQKVADKILNRFMKSKNQKKSALLSISKNAKYTKQEEKGHYEIREANGKWKIKVWVDGTKFIFSDRDYIEKNKIKGIPIDERFPNEDLEQIGRDYIRENLEEFVELASNEEIVPLWTEFELVGSMSENGDKVNDMITASRVHFGRKIDGIDIVGGGSRISVTVANDGAVVDVMLDWPKYRKSEVLQETVGVDEIMERLSSYGKIDIETDDVELERFECGYYDPGAKYSDPYGFIQSGCVAHTIGYDDQGNSGYRVINAIPSGEIVEWDDNWPEANAILNDGDLCEETDLSVLLEK